MLLYSCLDKYLSLENNKGQGNWPRATLTKKYLSNQTHQFKLLSRVLNNTIWKFHESNLTDSRYCQFKKCLDTKKSVNWY